MISLRDNLFLLARSNDDVGIEKLFIRDSGELDERNDSGLTALHICATYGCVEACAILLKLGAKHSLQDFESGWTPLHRAFYFGNLKVTLLLIRAGALIADEGESRDWRTGVFSRRERWRSIRNLSTWKANIDHDGLSPLDLLSLSLCQNLTNSKNELMCTSVLSFGKADFTLGVPLPNSVENIFRPRRIEPLSSERVSQIVASRFHSVALTRDGEVYSWGHGRAGRLGLGDENTQPEPRLITMLSGLVVRMISAGVNHTLAITDRGDLFSWGSDRFGQLGYGGSDAGKGSFIPKKVENLKKSVVVAIAAGDSHSVCFTDSGEIYTWGCNKEGQLGILPLERGAGVGGGSGISAPKRVYLPGQKLKQMETRHNRFQASAVSCPLLQVAASRCSTLLLCRPEGHDSTRRGAGGGASPPNEVYQWGHGSPYPSRVQFSRGLAPNPPSAVGKIDPMVDRFFGHQTAAIVNIVQLSAGLYHNVALSSMGHVYTWGVGSDQLGHGTLENRVSVPLLLDTLLPENGGGRIVMVSAANDRTCVVSDVGDLYTWGATAEKGILGLGAGSYQPIPKLVGGVKRAVSVAAGGDYTLVLTSATVPSMPFRDVFCGSDTASPLKVPASRRPQSSSVVIPGSWRPRVRASEGETTTSNGTSTASRVADNSVSSSSDSDSQSDDESESIDESNEEEEGDQELKGGSSIEQQHFTDSCEGQLITRVLSLQELCEMRIAESVDTRNVVALLAHAEAIGAKVLTAFCTQFIHSNLDAILVQSKPSDLDILIADLGSSDFSLGLCSSYRASTAASASASSSSGSKTAGIAASPNTAQVRSGFSRKLSKEDLEWHSRDSKHSGLKPGVKFEGRDSQRERGYSDGGSFHKRSFSIPHAEEGIPSPGGSGSLQRKDSFQGDVYGLDDCRDNMVGRRTSSKDFESLSGVTRLIRSVKKKLLSIDELEGRLREKAMKELNEEQKDKVSRRESLLSELKRLTLICTRLEGEERVKVAAKAQRDKAISEADAATAGTATAISSIASSTSRIPNNEDILTPSVSSPLSDPSISSIELAQCGTNRNSKQRVAQPAKGALKTAGGSPESVPPLPSLVVKQNSKGLHQNTKMSGSDRSGGRSDPSNAQAVQCNPPSFNDWLKVAQTCDDVKDSCSQSVSIPDSPLDLENTISMPLPLETKRVWGLLAPSSPIPIPSPSPTLNKYHAVGKGVEEAVPLTFPVKASISHIGPYGQTVLSPPLSRSTAPSRPPSTLSTPSTPMVKFQVAVPAAEKAPSRDPEASERQPSTGLSLADLMITPKKKNKQNNANAVLAVPGASKEASTPTVLKCASPCPWLSCPSPKTEDSLQGLKSRDQDVPSSGSKAWSKTLSEIQLEEETARLQSNLTSLKGNHNPWYQERRKRADSIEEVIRSQALAKTQEEIDKIEEENAIREVDLLKRREEKEKQKMKKNLQKAKLKARTEEKSKEELHSPDSIATPEIHRNDGGRSDATRGGGRARGGKGQTTAGSGQSLIPSQGPRSSAHPSTLSPNTFGDCPAPDSLPCTEDVPPMNRQESGNGRGRGGRGRGNGASAGAGDGTGDGAGIGAERVPGSTKAGTRDSSVLSTSGSGGGGNKGRRGDNSRARDGQSITRGPAASASTSRPVGQNS